MAWTILRSGGPLRVSSVEPQISLPILRVGQAIPSDWWRGEIRQRGSVLTSGMQLIHIADITQTGDELDRGQKCPANLDPTVLDPGMLPRAMDVVEGKSGSVTLTSISLSVTVALGNPVDLPSNSQRAEWVNNTQ